MGKKEMVPFGQNEKGLFEKIFSDWQLSLSGNLATSRTYSAAVARGTTYIAAVTGSPTAIARLTPGQAQQIYNMMAREYSVASANLSRAALSSLYEYLRKIGIPIDNVWKHVREKRARVELAERILTEEQVRALIQAAEPGLPRLLVRWLYYTGCRASEAASVRGRDLRRLPSGAWVCTVLGKGGKTRWVRLHDRLVGELARVLGWPPPRDARLFPLSRQQVYRIVSGAARRAGLPGASPHWLRHAHISHALDRGVPLHVVQQEVGHSSVAITDRYIHVAPGAGSAESLPWV